jgi:hypothetical protein
VFHFGNPLIKIGTPNVRRGRNRLATAIALPVHGLGGGVVGGDPNFPAPVQEWRLIWPADQGGFNLTDVFRFTPTPPQ